MIDHPYDDPQAWATYFSSAEIPVLRHSLQALQQMGAEADTANARVIAATVMQDPLLTLRVLQYIERHRGQRQVTDITTIERALVMIGTGPFFRDFGNLPILEDRLKNHPKAMLGLLKVVTRARKAAAWARDWAALRHDLDADEITLAALLHDISEMLMWCFAPTLALTVRDRQAHDATLRSADVQEEVYRIRLDDLQHELASQWRLPALLIMLMDPSKADHPRVLNVKLACDLARHSAHGWGDSALPDDYKAIGDLLHIDHETLMKRLGLDAQGQPV